MKKALLLTLAATMLSSGVALADPVELTGNVALQYRSNTNEVSGDKEGYKFTFTLNALTKLDAHFDLYARLGAQHVTEKSFADFADSSKHTDGAIDQYGFLYKNAGVDYKIGRQALTLGETALLYNTAPYIGQNMFADGVTATTKTGVTDVKVVVAQEDRSGDQDNKIYAVQASYSPAKDWKVGAVVARYDYEDGTKSDTNHWAVNAGYTFGKAGAVAEYTESSANADNKAHAIGMTYAFDSKNSAYVFAHRTEANGDMGAWTDFDNNQKGFYYGFDHKINKDTTFSLFFKDNEYLDSGKDNTSFRATVSYSF